MTIAAMSATLSLDVILAFLTGLRRVGGRGPENPVHIATTLSNIPYMHTYTYLHKKKKL